MSKYHYHVNVVIIRGSWDKNSEGNNYLFYDSENSEQKLAPEIALVNEQTYYATQTVNSLESDKASFVVTIVSPPIITLKTFKSGATVNYLTGTGNNLKFYDSASSSSQFLASEVTLASGTYYATQTVNSFESAKTSFVVTIYELTKSSLESLTIDQLNNLSLADRTELNSSTVTINSIEYKIAVPILSGTPNLYHIPSLTDNLKILGHDIDVQVGSRILKAFSNIGGTGGVVKIKNDDNTYTTLDKITLNNKSYNISYGCIMCTADITASSSGDPYITTFSGEQYKLPNIIRTYRLLEYPVDELNETVFVNASISGLTQDEQKDIIDYSRKYNNIQKPVLDGFFYDKFFIGTESSYAIFDRKLDLIEHKNVENFKAVMNTDLNMFKCPIQGESTFVSKTIYFKQVRIELRLYTNPQILNGIEVSVSNPSLGVGILNSDINPKNFVLRSIDNIDSLKDFNMNAKSYNKKVNEKWVKGVITV